MTAKEDILRKYGESTNNSLLTQELAGNTTRTQLKGVIGSGISFIAASAFQHIHKTNLFILADKEEAAYFLNDLENLIGEQNVLFFPASYRMPYEHEEIDNANILLRAEVLNKINTGKKHIAVVTYPEALTEKVVTKAHLTKNTLELKQGEKISIDFITDVLNEYGFERADYVVEPGQYSVRGGIVDIFSFSNEHPYRVEFLGNEVDSIRSFDPISQLSIHKLTYCSIIPNVQTKLLQESRQTLFEFFPESTVLWFKHFQLTLDRIEKAFALAELSYSKLDNVIAQLPPEELYIHKDVFSKQALGFPVVEFGNHFSLAPTKTITYNFSPQPSFNKNFSFLNDNFKSNLRNGLTNIIFADAAKQIERLYKIFEDIAPKKSEEPEVFTPILLSIHEGFIDNELKLACYTDHQIFDRYHRFRLKSSFSKKNEALTLKELKGLNPGDYITHIDYGVGRYGGLETIEVNGKTQETIRLIYKDYDIVNISIHSLHRIAKYSGKEGAEPKINKLGTNTWATLKQKTKKKVKEIAYDLIQLYAKRKALKGFQFSPDTYLQNELEASFIYEDTPDQIKSTADVKKDMESEWPMDRLVCGDVGFGKTEVAVRAAFKAVCDSKQVAILVPTTILALQHYKTFKERLKDLPCTVDYINRYRSSKQQKETLEKVAEGKVDILIGTHGIVGKGVKFKDLGLIIIDEEQKFGVGVKDKLKTIKTNVDTLTLTATPIPRTLQFSMMGARDLSVISTPPPNRYPVQTELHTFNEEIIRDAVSFEISRGGQVFFVHNRVQNILEIAGMIQRLCPDAKVAIGHGQLEGDKLEQVMMDFVEGEYDVLVATTIIEAGLDISNANTIIINQAHMFGLSDLHQMRGRVGRSNKKAFCYLLTTPVSLLTPEARKRLKAIEEFSDLGSGFNIAMRDLDIRGAGNLLGGEQSGFINEIGFEMYQKILDEAIMELRMEHEELRDTNVGGSQKYTQKQHSQYISDCVIDTDMEILIPDEYVNNITERLNLYRELDDSNNEEALTKFEAQLKDRFGPVPEQALELIHTIRLRWLAMEIGFEKLILKNNRMVGYFLQNQQSPYYQSETFTKVLKFVQHNARVCKMKENNGKLSLTFENIKSIDDAMKVLKPVIN
ncbi:MAG: transcription-repair coupling factor [Bacteroidetes bacterium]|nr:transcription-repair coupling factor [Bacteroidota bacterium]